MTKSKISINDIVSIAKDNGIEPQWQGSKEKFEAFAIALLAMIEEELQEQRKSLRSEIDSWDHWALLKISGKGALILGSWIKQPDWLMLADVKDLQSTYSIAQVRLLAKNLEFKVDNWTTYKLIKLEAPPVEESVD